MKKTKKLLALFLVFTFILSMVPTTKSNAASSGYITATATFKIVNDTLYIEGTGEIPDYIGVDYLSRPWNGQSYTKVNIASTITRVGQYAFANNSKLQYIDIYSTTFLANSTCFAYSNYDVIMRIHGSAPTYKQLGGVSYSSWESFATGAPVGRNSIFVLDNSTLASHFRSMRYPYYNYVYSVDMEDSPWATKEKLFSEDAFSNVCHLAVADGSTLSAAKEPASETFMKNVGDYIALSGYHYLATYRLYYFESGKLVNSPISKYKKYVLNLDTNWQVDGVDFKLLQICDDGSFYILTDLDTSIKTLTFQTNNATGYYILVY